MGVVIRQSLKGSIVSYIGLVFGSVSTLWIMPYFLEPEQYGLIKVLVSIALVLFQFSQFGTTSTIVRFYPKFKNVPYLRNAFIGFQLVVPLIGFVVCILFLYLFKEYVVAYYSHKSPQIGSYLNFSIIICFGYLYLYLLNAYCRSLFRITVPIIITEILLRTLIIVTVLLYGFGLVSFNLFIWLFAASHIIVALVQLVYANQLRPLSPSFSVKKIKKLPIKAMLLFSSFVSLGGSAGILIQNIDLLMVASLGLDKAAIYMVSFFIGTFIEIPKRSIFKITEPIIAEHWHKNETLKIAALYKDSSINLFVIGLFLLGLIWLSIDHLFVLLPKSEIYAEGKWVVFFIGIARVIDMGSGANSEIIRNSDNYRFDFISMLFLTALSVILNYFLIKSFGIKGAAIATLLSLSVYNLIKFIFLYKKHCFQPFSIAHLLTLIVAAGLFFAVSFISPMQWENTIVSSLANIMINSVLYGSLYLIVIYFLNVSPEINRIVKKIMRKIF